jgi:hypothetical protein
MSRDVLADLGKLDMLAQVLGQQALPVHDPVKCPQRSEAAANAFYREVLAFVYLAELQIRLIGPYVLRLYVGPACQMFFFVKILHKKADLGPVIRYRSRKVSREIELLDKLLYLYLFHGYYLSTNRGVYSIALPTK